MKNLKNILLALCIILSASALCAGAEGSLDITSKSGRVHIGDDKIEVEQMPYFFDNYSLTSVDLINALVSYDYKLSYTDADKNVTDKQFFTDGYIRAEHVGNSEDVMYIPVVMYKAEETEFDLNSFYFNNSGGSSKSSKSDICGRSDNSYVITPPSGGSTKIEGVNAQPSYDGAGIETTYTAEINIYAEGNVTAFAHARYTGDNDRTVFKWYPDGSVEINDGGSFVKVTNAERGNWHKLALTYSAQRNRVIVYLDGELISRDTSPWWRDVTCFVYGTDSGSSDGFYALGDGNFYRGYYYPSYYAPTELEADCDELLIDGGTIWTDFSSVKSFEDMSGLISGFEEAVSVGDFGEGAKLITINGTDYKCYTLKNGLFADVTFKKEDGKIGASATVVNKLRSEKSAVMAMCFKNSDGAAVGVSATGKQAIASDGTVFEISPLEADSAEVVFITDWENRIPVFFDTFTEDKQ